MTEPTTSFDLSTPDRVEKLRAEAAKIDVWLGEDWLHPEGRATLTRRRDRIRKALEDHMHAADQIGKR